MLKYFKSFILLFFSFYLIACSFQPNKDNLETSISKPADTSLALQTNDSLSNSKGIDTTDYENATYYFVVVDTSFSYSILCNKMFNISKRCHLTIDSIGRFYNKKKDLIILPENDEDELYAGNYFPRRYPSDFLSLEYLNFYSQNSNNKTIALMAGIFEAEHSADSLLAIIKPIEKTCFKMKAEIYIGCMH